MDWFIQPFSVRVRQFTHTPGIYMPWFLLFLLCSYQIRHISVFCFCLFILFVFLPPLYFFKFPFFYFIAPNKVIPRMCISCARPHINEIEIVILTRKRSITAIFLHTTPDGWKNKQRPIIFVKIAWKHVCVRKKWPESILNRIIHTEYTRPPRNPSTLDRNDGYLWYDCGWSVP